MRAWVKKHCCVSSRHDQINTNLLKYITVSRLISSHRSTGPAMFRKVIVTCIVVTKMLVWIELQYTLSLYVCCYRRNHFKLMDRIINLSAQVSEWMNETTTTIATAQRLYELRETYRFIATLKFCVDFISHWKHFRINTLDVAAPRAQTKEFVLLPMAPNS